MASKFNTILLLFLLSIIGCNTKNDSNPIIKEHLIGNWVNITDTRDTLFIGDTIIHRIYIPSSEPILYYRYTLNGNEITIEYLGIFAIYVPESTFHIELENDLLTIVNFSSYFPGYNGDIFKKLENR